MKKIYIFSLLMTIVCLATSLLGYGQTYTWNQVRIGGSGAIPTFIAHPAVPDLYFVTTDVGTPYRWNKNLQKWEHMMLFDKIPVNYWRWEVNQRCSNMAVDPNDATGNILYAMVEHSEGPSPGQGNRNKGTILKSTNRGDSWTDLHVPITVNPNAVKGFDDRIHVDPSNSNVVWAVTDTSGAWRTENAGSTWTQQSSVSMATERLCAFILFDTTGGTTVVNGQTVTKRIYLGRSTGIFVSNDGGASFIALANSPAKPGRATLHPDGTLFVTNNEANVKKGVFKYHNGTWQEITPIYLDPNSATDARTFAKVAVNPANVNDVVVSTYGAWQKDPWFISRQGGATGTWAQGKITRDNSEAPHSANDGLPTNSPGHAPFSFTWDPFYPNRVWLNDLLDVVVTNNIFDAVSNWKVRVVGLEEIMVTGPMVAPPSGKNLLLSVTADVGGAHHRSLTDPLVQGAVSYTAINTNIFNGLNSQGVAFQYTNPDFVVRVGSDSWGFNAPSYSRAGYSTNGGDTYTLFPTSPGVRGRVAVSANSQNIVWLTQMDNNAPGNVYWSNNLGSSWTKATGAPSGILAAGDQWVVMPGQNHLVADKVNGNFFYIWDRGNFYVSSDAGHSFTKTDATGLFANNGSNPNGSAYATASNIEVTPGKTGDVWIAFHNESAGTASGLYHTTDTGRTFSRVGDLNFRPKWIAVAMSDTTPNAHLALYVTSAVYPINNVYFGAFRSDDTGRTWTTIADRLPGAAPNITADNRGRMFISNSGNGIFYGTPVAGPVQSVEILNAVSDTLVKGFSLKLNAKLTPTYPTNPAVTWSSSDTSKAKVDAYGNVTAINAGTVTITLTSADGGHTDTHTIIVVPPTISSDITIDSTTYGTVQTPTQITASVVPANTTNKTLTWSVGDPTVATVNASGVVMGLKVGFTSLTVTTVDGGATRTVPLRITTIVRATNAGTQSAGATPATPYANVIIGQYVPEGLPNSPNLWHAGYTGNNQVTATIDTSLITEPAPKKVYEWVRWSKHNGTQMRYYMRGLIPNASYVIRLHFLEHDNAQKTNRIFTVRTTPTLDSLVNFNIYAAAGNKLNTVITRTLNAKANSAGVVEVWFYPKVATNDPHSALIAAVEARIIPLEGISISSDSNTISVNHTDTLRLTTTPVNATNRSVVYSSSDVAIATVDINGVVKGIGAGSVTITATSVVGGFTATKTYTVVFTPVSNLVLNTASANVFVGDALALTATISPAKASNKTVLWTSSDTTVAKVNTTGIVTGIKDGDAVIKATAADNASIFAQTNVHVANVLATAVTLSPSSAIIGERDTLLVRTSFTPANTSIKTLSWTSSDTTIAKVNAAGIVSAIKAGTASITVTTQDTSGVYTVLPVTIVPFDSCGGIKNNGFESDMLEFIAFKNDVLTPGAAYTVSGQGHTGDKAATLGFSTDKTGMNIKDPVPVRPGSIIVFTKWVKVVGGAQGYPWWAGFGVSFVNAAGGATGSANFQHDLHNVTAYRDQWAQIRDTVTVPDSAVALNYWAAKIGPGTVWFDDFCIETITTNKAAVYAVNAGTQQTNTTLPQTPYAATSFAQYQPEGPTGTDKKWHAGYTWIESVSGAVDVSGVEDPAPAQVYEYVRISKVNITPLRHYLRGLTPNKLYNIRLHFVEHSNAQKANRIFSVKATKGLDSLIEFNPYQAAGNVLNKAVVRTIRASADSTGLITVFFYPKSGTYDPYSASLAALEVRDDAMTAYAGPNFQTQRAVVAVATTPNVLQFDTQVFPNPSEGYFTVKVSSPSQAPILLTVVDITGRRVHTATVFAGKPYLLGSKLKAGVYHLTVQQGKDHTITKLVKL